MNSPSRGVRIRPSSSAASGPSGRAPIVADEGARRARRRGVMADVGDRVRGPHGLLGAILRVGVRRHVDGLAAGNLRTRREFSGCGGGGGVSDWTPLRPPPSAAKPPSMGDGDRGKSESSAAGVAPSLARRLFCNCTGGDGEAECSPPRLPTIGAEDIEDRRHLAPADASQKLARTAQPRIQSPRMLLDPAVQATVRAHIFCERHPRMKAARHAQHETRPPRKQAGPRLPSAGVSGAAGEERS
eukprot:CAMPEP_0203932046 /NCGR_PEP_ID=MMETSP0359-20131031/70509_1 /ASSEMBLY_ACC=CAM_ASM_000338 /TAXON_ID=268821 /ORGANISM="Scrippsiella Hangoei, Strain SHTV-5" /LENGTH=242 /DNA_ID=CAMNT_0050861449 /DNA_START=297 /DNA_END=1024 /DNA_ORIENTATION=-